MIATKELATMDMIDRQFESHRIQRHQLDASGRWFIRGGGIEAGSASDAERSAVATIATERPVPAYDRRSGRIVDEILLMRGGQFPKWAPLLEAHQTWSMYSVLGSVHSTSRSGRVARGRFEFARDDEHVEQIWRKVRDGHIRGVSVGGQRASWVDIQPGESATVFGRRFTAGRERPLRVTTSWLMREASIVIFPADIDSGVNG
ncbi:MAG: hypothetical protein AAFX06_14895 [Planctomycetota bacterium]